MSLAITTSPDITLLDFAILYDLSTGTPSITLTNRSVGNPSGTTNLANCTWFYTVTTPSGVYVHEGTEASPDVTTANWTTLTITPGSWPTPFGTPPYGQVEFSCGVPYVATLYVKDSNGDIFSLSKSLTICRPAGNTDKTLGNFGVADVTATVNCATASVVTNDTTNYTYQNKAGSYAGNTWTFQAPMDDNGNMPEPMVVEGEGRVFFPVGYSAEGYQLYMNSIQQYDMGDYQTIKLQYKFKSVFPIWCNVNLCEAYCQVEALEAQLEKTCGDVENPKIQKKLDKVRGLIQDALMGIAQPLCGINVPAIIEKIKKIGGAKCNCSGLGGINPIGNTDGSINLTTTTTGAITATVTNTGNNYNIALAVPGSSAGTLQEVTDNGNQTTNDIVVGNPAAGNTKIQPTKTQAYRAGTSVLAGFGEAAPGDLEGAVWMRSTSSNGTVYLKAKTTGNTYVLIMPGAQGSAGQTLVNDGTGILSWGSSTGNLQDVTDVGNSTSNPILIVNNALEFNRLSAFKLFLYPEGGFTANRIQRFLDESGAIPTLENPHEWSGVQTFQAGKLKVKGVSAGAMTISAPTAISDYTIYVPSTQGALGTFLRNDGLGNLTWTSPGNMPVQTVTTDSDIAITAANTTLLVLNSTLAANRTITLPTAVDGDQLMVVIARQPGSAFKYSFNTYVRNMCSLVTADQQITDLFDGISYGMIYSGSLSRWVVISQANLGNKQTTSISRVSNSGAPTITAGAALGTSPTIALTPGSNYVSGEIVVTVGSAPPVLGDIIKLEPAAGTYRGSGGRFSSVLITPSNEAASKLTGIFAFGPTTGGWHLLASNPSPLIAAETYKWYYHVIVNE